jgi:hypothetical protein
MSNPPTVANPHCLIQSAWRTAGIEDSERRCQVIMAFDDGWVRPPLDESQDGGASQFLVTDCVRVEVVGRPVVRVRCQHHRL